MSDNRGISCLGLCHPLYDIDGLEHALNQATVARWGWIDNFFNERNSDNAARLFRTHLRKVVRVHIINGPALNNNRVQPHEITRRMTHSDVVRAAERGNGPFMQRFRERCQFVRSIAIGGQLLELWVSPWLEHGLITRRAWRNLVDVVMDEIPNANIIDSARDGYHVARPNRQEWHGNVSTSRTAKIIDMDGIDYAQIERDVGLRNYARRHANRKVNYLWGISDNGFYLGEEWKPPQRRTNFTRFDDYPIYKQWVRPDYA